MNNKDNKSLFDAYVKNVLLEQNYYFSSNGQYKGLDMDKEAGGGSPMGSLRSRVERMTDDQIQRNKEKNYTPSAQFKTKEQEDKFNTWYNRPMPTHHVDLLQKIKPKYEKEYKDKINETIQQYGQPDVKKINPKILKMHQWLKNDILNDISNLDSEALSLDKNMYDRQADSLDDGKSTERGALHTSFSDVYGNQTNSDLTNKVAGLYNKLAELDSLYISGDQSSILSLYRDALDPWRERSADSFLQDTDNDVAIKSMR
jgi:hypothetical protein